MKKKLKKPTIDQIASYQNAFDYFNSALFDGSLPQVILNFSRLNSKTIAFYAPKRWEKKINDKRPLDEISLNPVYLGRDLDDIFSSLVHEQCHLWQYKYGKPSRRGYHNLQWAKKMLEVGLFPKNIINGKLTGQSMSHYIVKGGNFDKVFKKMPKRFQLPWRVFIENNDHKNKKKKSKSGKRIKYTCPGCSLNVWGKQDINMLCLDCKVKFNQELL